MRLLLLCFHPRQYRGDADGRLLHFLVGSQAIVNLLVSGNFEKRTRFRILDRRDGRKNFLDTLFHPRHVKIAHHRNSLQIGTIPLTIKITDGLMFKIFDNIEVTDYIPFGIFRILEQPRQRLCQQTELRRTAGAPLLGNNTPFGIDFITVKRQVVRPVVQYQQTGIQKPHIGGRHGADIINRFILSRISIDVTAKGHSVLLQSGNDSLARKIFSPVKGHVFQKVGQTVLVIVFKQCTHIADNIKTGPVFRLLIVTDIISNAVGQFTDHRIRVRRQRTLQIDLPVTSQSQEETDG